MLSLNNSKSGSFFTNNLGIALVTLNHAYSYQRTGHKDCICVLTHHAQTYVQCIYSVETLSAIAHQMRCSQVLPGYPHSSAGTYVSMSSETMSNIFVHRLLELYRIRLQSSIMCT